MKMIIMLNLNCFCFLIFLKVTFTIFKSKMNKGCDGGEYCLNEALLASHCRSLSVEVLLAPLCSSCLAESMLYPTAVPIQLRLTLLAPHFTSCSAEALLAPPCSSLSPEVLLSPHCGACPAEDNIGPKKQGHGLNAQNYFLTGLA